LFLNGTKINEYKLTYRPPTMILSSVYSCQGTTYLEISITPA